jgi:hypothetical protein
MARCCDAGGSVGSRTEPRGEGSRPQRAAPMPRVREEGAGGGFGEVAGAGRLDQASGSSLRRRSGPGWRTTLDAAPCSAWSGRIVIAKPVDPTRRRFTSFTARRQQRPSSAANRNPPKPCTPPARWNGSPSRRNRAEPRCLLRPRSNERQGTKQSSPWPGDRGFESISLQQRVACESDLWTAVRHTTGVT